MKRRLLSTFLSIIIVFVSFVSILDISVSATTFTPRTTAPSSSNAYYYSLNPFYNSGYGMPNCTAYAYGRAYEILGSKPNLSTGNAGKWWWNNISAGAYSYGSTPKLGAIACWDRYDQNRGHVAVVEAIDGNSVTISESHYQSTFFDTRVINADSSNYLTSMRFLGYIYIGDFSTDSNPTDISKIEIVNLGDSFSARIRNVESLKLLTDTSNNIDLRSHSNAKIGNQIWKFNRNSDGSYSINSSINNKCFDLDCSNDSDGTNIHLWENNYISGQKWYIHKTSDGAYCFRPQCSSIRVLDITSGNMNDGTNIQLYTFNNTSSQKFYIDKCGEILNLGDQFSGFIMNTDSWKPIMQTDDYNVVLGTETRENMNRTLWRFERDSDTGCYTITSYLNEKCLDVDNALDEDCTNVKCYDSNNSLAQRWYILKAENGNTYLKAACSSRNLDLENGSTNDGTNVQMYSINNTSAQWFTIYQLDSERDKLNYSIISDKSEIKLGESCNITIGDSLYAINYKLHIIEPDGVETIVDNKCKINYSFLPTQIGEYIIYAEVTSPLSNDIGSSTEKCIKINVVCTLGDINNDGALSKADMYAWMGIYSNQNITPPTDYELAVGDLNGNGKYDASDKMLLNRLIS